MAKSFIRYHIYQDLQVPVRISLEWRTNVRISISRKYVSLRIPAPLASERSIRKQLDWAVQWIDQQFQAHPEMLNRFRVKQYREGDSLRINDQTFSLHFLQREGDKVRGRIHQDKVLISLPAREDPQRESEAIKKLLSQLFGRHFKKYIVERVYQLNDQYIGESFNDVRVKYNRSNWGSCSAKRNINISSRILFAPRDVQDYVILHELTHLKELNHSKRFWSIIASIMPDYRAKERWLKANSAACDF